ncbi:MAG: hypothetical protein LBP28_06120 [Coriobacteriales bacterium]|jgi:hypothetical protein|nr:hypothetical protein [Coriobacteriales bacterium]
MQCPTCGYVFEGTPASCPQCGVGFTYQQPPQQQPAQQPPQQQPPPYYQQTTMPTQQITQPPQQYYQQPQQSFYYQPQPGYNYPYYQIRPAVVPPPSGATPSMVLGIVSLSNILFSFVLAGLSIPLSTVLSIIGLVLGFKANKERKTSQATAGLIMNGIGLGLSVLFTIAVIALIVAVFNGYFGSNSYGYRYLS